MSIPWTGDAQECHPTPAATDPRTMNLPLPAVKLAQRMAQAAKAGGLVMIEVIIVDGVWYLRKDGKSERLGTDKE